MIARLICSSSVPAGREVDLLAELLEQRVAGVLFQLSHLRRNGGLRQMKLFCGAREAQQPRDRLEHLQLAQSRVLHLRVHRRVLQQLKPVSCSRTWPR